MVTPLCVGNLCLELHDIRALSGRPTVELKSSTTRNAGVCGSEKNRLYQEPTNTRTIRHPRIIYLPPPDRYPSVINHQTTIKFAIRRHKKQSTPTRRPSHFCLSKRHSIHQHHSLFQLSPLSPLRQPSVTQAALSNKFTCHPSSRAAFAAPANALTR